MKDDYNIYDPLLRPLIMENVEMTGCTYAYDISVEDMSYIHERDHDQGVLDRKPLHTLLTEVSDASRVGYFHDGHHIYFTLQSRHNTYESMQEVIDHVTLYVDGLDCHWITGE
jgi:hypothetical protein